jgi:uncharacterized protein (TIGR02646 family)
MRKITINPPNDPTWNKWCTDCQEETEKLHQQHAQGKTLTFEPRLYSHSKEFFREAFHGKCAYCESSVSVNQPGDIEHFRPKAEVTDLENCPVSHPGYYWLAYDWRNLLLSCALCNRVSIYKKENIGKGTRFPVVGIHAQTPDAIESEQPLLINPASDRPEDDPAQHLGIDLATGLLIPKSARGETCIEVFELNKRNPLIKERKEAINYAKLLFFNLKNGSKKDKMESLAKIKEIRQGQRPFSLAQVTELERLYQLIDTTKE